MSKYNPKHKQSPVSKGRILLLINHRKNRRLLADWLKPEYDVITPESSIESSFDLCIVDESSFSQYRDDLITQKETTSPSFLPYLFITSTTSPAQTPEMWEEVDEVITTPIEKAVLQARINGLLERRRLSVEIEQDKKQSEKRFKTLFQTAPDPVFVLDIDGQIQSVNSAFCEVSGLDRASILGEPIESIPAFPNESLEQLTEDIYQHEDDKLPPYSITYTAPDGETRYAEINTARMQFDTERPEIIGIFRDVTEHKHRKQELQHQNERLDEFASMLAHELRNPLGIAQGYLRVAESEGSEDAFEEVHEALERMEQMINEMLDLARRPEAINDTERTEFYDIIESAWSRIAPPKATLMLENVDVEISADVDRLSQVFDNLFRNAVDHVGEDVSVRVGRLSDGVYVEDDGPGISPEHYDSVFESGYTMENGTGLGLSIAQQIVEAHGWDIKVTEGSKGGARFEIRGMQLDKETE
ncbi:sensor histidine kinase [Haladaptatus caseinilyticus]|uniref:sensor histidine kinase n=1 Tax=Haladaptatus caseinilyticus TaxID=2993314 RepID=UPI00224B0991|nr:PAS domain S-box protein [Haladaptatus caseinilyticus]